VENLHFPHWEDADTPLSDTILDGELVIDVDPATGNVS
jgi:mRNA guanylyltransferase